MKTHESERVARVGYTPREPLFRPAPTHPRGNRKTRRTMRKVGAFFGQAEFASVRVERADGRCIGRKLVRK